jgi:hypothetical protein
MTYDLLSKSKFNRLFLELNKNEHSYVDGSQHLSSKDVHVAYTDSFVVVLQNDKGKQEFSSEKIAEIKANFAK